jgi:hypothetical protein
VAVTLGARGASRSERHAAQRQGGALPRLFGSVPGAVCFNGLEMVDKGFKAGLQDGFGMSAARRLSEVAPAIGVEHLARTQRSQGESCHTPKTEASRPFRSARG